MDEYIEENRSDDHMNAGRDAESTGLSQAHHKIPYGSFIPLPGNAITLPPPTPFGSFIPLPAVVALGQSENARPGDISRPIDIDTPRRNSFAFEEVLMQMLQTEISTPTDDETFTGSNNKSAQLCTFVDLLEGEEQSDAMNGYSKPMRGNVPAESPADAPMSPDWRQMVRSHIHDPEAELRRNIRKSEANMKKEIEILERKKRREEARKRSQQKKLQFHELMAASNGERHISSQKDLFSGVLKTHADARKTAGSGSKSKSLVGDKTVKSKSGRKRQMSENVQPQPIRQEEQLFRDSAGRPRYLSLDEQHELSLAHYTHVSVGVSMDVGSDDSVSVLSPGIGDARGPTCNRIGDKEDTPMRQESLPLAGVTERA